MKAIDRRQQQKDALVHRANANRVEMDVAAKANVKLNLCVEMANQAVMVCLVVSVMLARCFFTGQRRLGQAVIQAGQDMERRAAERGDRVNGQERDQQDLTCKPVHRGTRPRNHQSRYRSLYRS